MVRGLTDEIKKAAEKPAPGKWGDLVAVDGDPMPRGLTKVR